MAIATEGKNFIRWKIGDVPEGTRVLWRLMSRD